MLMRFSMCMLFILNRGLINAVVTDTHSRRFDYIDYEDGHFCARDCNKIFSGVGGEIVSPDFPFEYPDNLGCTWVIKADVNSRIRIFFEEFQLEEAPGCLDKFVVNDGIQKDSPTLGIFCGKKGKGSALTSSGNTMFLQFTTDESIGDKGIKIIWEAIPRIPLNLPSDTLFKDPWQSLAVPKNVIDFDAGYQLNSLWVLDHNHDIFYYDGQTWDIYAGKLKSITVGETGIFGINPKNESIYWREDASVNNPEGSRWVLISKNTKGIRMLESASGGYIYGIDKENDLYFTHISKRNDLDASWLKVNLNLEDTNDLVKGAINVISCNVYVCWLTIKSGVIYGMTSPSKPAGTFWSTDYGNYKEVSSGFGNNVWSVNSYGDVFKKEFVGSLKPLGGTWKQQFGIKLNHIAAGIGGVFGLNENGDLAFYKDSICGGYLFEATGTLSSPNYPSNYPANQSCLWIVKLNQVNAIDLNFQKLLEIKQKPLCADYLATSYPGNYEPIVECGDVILDKTVEADLVWVEFVSDGNDEGVGFSINYRGYESLTTTVSPTGAQTTTPPPANWELFFPSTYFDQDMTIKSTSLSSLGDLWIIGTSGRVFIRKNGLTEEILGRRLVSMTHMDNGVTFAIDENRNLITMSNIGNGWKDVETNTNYAKIFAGLNGMILVQTDSGLLKYCFYKDTTNSLDCNIFEGIQNTKAHVSTQYGLWVVLENGETKFLVPAKKPNSNLYKFLSQTLKIYLADLSLDNQGRIWGIFQNGSVVYQNGVSSQNPYGLKEQWTVLPLQGVKLLHGENEMMVEIQDGTILKKKDNSVAPPLPTDWLKLTSSLQNPFKIEAFPNEERLDVWVLDGKLEKYPFYASYQYGEKIDFAPRGSLQLIDISVGESGVWGIDTENKARFYNSGQNKWTSVENDDVMWKTIESASPQGAVYTIDLFSNQLYFRDGITLENPTGTKWVATGVYIKQISSGLYITYVVMSNDQLQSFGGPPTKDNLKFWRNTWKITNKIIQNKISMGFDGTLVYLTNDNMLIQREPLHMGFEEDDSKWRWNPTTLQYQLQDVTAGPVIFGISQKDIFVKQVTSCFAFYNQISSEVSVQLKSNQKQCSWLVTSPASSSISSAVVKSNIQSSLRCNSGGLFYSTNHRSPLIGNINSYCNSDTKFQETTGGNRGFYQYLKDAPSPTDELIIAFKPKNDEAAGCNQKFTGSQGIIQSPNYPEDYPNKADCRWEITVNKGEKIEFIFVDGEIEFGGLLCDYDFLKIYDGVSVNDQLLGTYCGDMKTKDGPVSSGNQLLLHFKTDTTKVRKGFSLKWKAVANLQTTSQPTTISTTSYSACGGSLNSNQGSISSPNYPSNYENKLNCEWFIKTERNSKILLQIVNMDIEQSTNCVYDFLEIFDGEQTNAKSFGKYCGTRQKIILKTSGNLLRLVFHSDTSTNSRGFLAIWSIETGSVEKTLPSGWQKINTGFKTEPITSITRGLHDDVWLIDDKNKVHGVYNDSAGYIIQDSMSQLSADRLGAWGLGPDNKIYYLQKPIEANKYAKHRHTEVEIGKDFENELMKKILTTMFNVYLLTNSNSIYYREGVSGDQPTGTKWIYYRAGKDIAENAYGKWLVTRDSDLLFISYSNEETQISSPVPGSPFQKVFAGFGNSLFVVVDNELYKRVGINLQNPSGLKWETTGLYNVKELIINYDRLFALMKDNTVIKKEEIICGGALRSKASYINYPEFDSGYKKNQYCLWFIDIPDSKTLGFSQRRFSIEDSPDCSKDRVTIFSPTAQDTVVTACGNGFQPQSMVFNANLAFVEFVSDGVNNGRGFALSYRALNEIPLVSTTTTTENPTTTSEGGCIFTYTNPKGFISSPYYPEKYPNNLNCVYKIRLNTDQRITLQFLKVELEEDATCQFDYLKIYERDSTGQQKLQKTYCGSRDNINDYHSSSNELEIVFRSDSSTQSQGFNINYMDTEAAGITTPGTKRSYPPGWEEISPPSQTFMHLDASVESPIVWGTDLTGSPFYYDISTKSWKSIDKPSENIKLAVGRRGLYAIDKNNEFFVRVDSHENNAPGSYWGRVFNSDKKLKEIEYGANKELLAITTDNKVVTRLGISEDSLSGTIWKEIATGFHAVSVGTYGYWLKNENDEIFFATFIPSRNIITKLNVVPINGKFKKVVAGFGGNVWALDRDNFVYRRLNVNSLNPSGTRWEKIEYNGNSLLLFDISAGYDAVYGISSTGRIVRYSGTYCGGIYETAVGSLQSPSFPGFYPSNVNCLYIVDTAEFDQLTLSFSVFDIERTTGCYKDYILIALDGQYPSRYAVEKYCGDKMDRKVFLKRALLEFYADDTIEGSGFDIRWKAEKVQTTPETTTPMMTTRSTTSFTKTLGDDYYRKCGGSLAGDEGIIVHPRYPETYQNSRDCNYIITVKPNKVIKIEIQELDFESSETCSYDYIEIIDNLGKKRQRYCKLNKDHSTFVSTGRNIAIHFYTDEIGQQNGFKLRWRAVDDGDEGGDSSVTTTHTTITERKTTTTLGTSTTELTPTEETKSIDCKKTYKSYSGYIHQNNYPRSYKNNVNCIWTVEAPGNHVIKLKFIYFKLELSLNCENDYVAVYDGGDTGSTLLGKFCGPTLPNTIYSTGQEISVVLKTNDRVTDQGLVVLYTRASKGVIETTKTPTEDCRFSLTGDSGVITHPGYPDSYDINLDCYWFISTIQNAMIQVTFEEFEIESAGDCSYDFLQIKDDGDYQGKDLGKLCGDSLPNTITTSGNKLSIRFRSDDRQTRKGFKMNWKAVYQTPITTTSVTITKASPCIEYLSGDSGEISSPGYPNEYNTYSDCHWFIETDSQKRIQLFFTEMNVEVDPTCSYNVLRVYDGYSDLNDYLYVNNAQKELGKFCSNIELRDLVSTTNRVRLHFRSENRKAGKRFQIKWKAFEEVTTSTTTTPIAVKTTQSNSKDCAFILSGTSGVITHPNYPAQYRTNQLCTWELIAPTSQVVELTFKEFNVENSPRCYYDYLSIYDGEISSDLEIGKFCGSTSPQRQYSSGNKISLKFYSDDRQVRDGFRIEWKAINTDEKVCGGVYTATSNSFSHSTYPSNYLPNQDCLFTMNAPAGYRIVVYFKEFDLENSRNCANDFIQISEGADNEKRFLGSRYCGTRKPQTVRSDRGVVTIQFKTNADVQKRGFKAEYYFELIQTETPETTKPTTVSSTTQVDTTTNAPSTTKGEYEETIPYKSFHAVSGDNGEFYHYGYPSHYQNNIDSRWEITTSPGKRIGLRFNLFSLQKDALCRYDYVEVFHIDNEAQSKIGRFCNENPGLLRSRGNKMIIVFHTDFRLVNTGFVASWFTEEIEHPGYDICDSSAIKYDGDALKLVSPGFYYSQNYPPNKHCVLHLTSRPGTIFEIQITDFELEDKNQISEKCPDFLGIRDGDAKGKSLGTFCGNRNELVKQKLFTNSNNLHIEFKSNDQKERRGFHIRLETLIKPDTNKQYTSDAHECGEVIDAPSGKLSSPSIVSSDSEILYCVWIIKAAPSSRIKISFNQLELRGACDQSFLTIRDGGHSFSPMIGKYCGYHENIQLLSNSDEIFIEYKTPSNELGKFALTWFQQEAKDYTCGGVLTGQGGYINLPDYPSGYTSPVYCLWNIMGLPNNKISLSIENMLLGKNCERNYVYIRDGMTTEAKTLEKLCKKSSTLSYLSTGNSLMVEYRAACIDKKVFRARWSSVKNGEVIGTSDVTVGGPRVKITNGLVAVGGNKGSLLGSE